MRKDMIIEEFTNIIDDTMNDVEKGTELQNPTRDPTILLNEVKDILDELIILKEILVQQKDVWRILIGITWEQDIARGPEYMLREIDKMINSATTVQKSVNDGINSIEAILSRKQAVDNARQGKVLMAFTIVTVIFTPLSFLTSFFALNITVFQHNSQGNIEYEPGWIFPILFCVSAGVIGPVMIYVFFNYGKNGIAMTQKARNALFEVKDAISMFPGDRDISVHPGGVKMNHTMEAGLHMPRNPRWSSWRRSKNMTTDSILV
ncbi:hypothetical protein M426DRAFT_173923 [Hypoxylon sp. CI-4A]|nr:hypothetical protein M426DRAFT_173923 [Hypoxylon sp. CI-4A]